VLTGGFAEPQLGPKTKKPRPVTRLLGIYSNSQSGTHHPHLLAVLRATGIKLDFTIGSREQRVVFASTNVVSGMEAGATLSNDDAARGHFLPTKYFDAKSFAFGIAAVTGTTASFFCVPY
jgi:hypothetical protein